MFKLLLLLGAGAVLVACGGGGGGGVSRAFPTITNEGLLPAITKVKAPAASGIKSTLDLGNGVLSLSLSHDRFLAGSFRFLGRSGEMGQVHETGLNLGYRYDF